MQNKWRAAIMLAAWACNSSAPVWGDQTAAPASVIMPSAAQAALTIPSGPPTGILIKKDTPVRLMVMTEVSTKTDMVGHRFRLAVDEPVIVDGKVTIPDGTPAWGEVTGAERSGNVGKSGSLTARLLFIDLAGTHVAISGETQANGQSGTGETVLAVLGLGPFGLFAKGNNAKIKAGERMTAFVLEDTLLPLTPPSALKPS